MNGYSRIKFARYGKKAAIGNKPAISRMDVQSIEKPQDEWKLDFDYFRVESKKRGLKVSYNQASDFASHVALLVMDGKMDLDKARMHAFNRVLCIDTGLSADSKFLTLFIQNIPENCHPNELRRFVEQGLKSGLFFRPGRVMKAEILAIQCKQTKLIEYHGLVHIDSKIADLPAILEKLKPKRLKRKVVLVREYKQRFWQNDNRRQANQSPGSIVEKRIGDRRRGHKIKIIKDISPISGEANASLEGFGI